MSDPDPSRLEAVSDFRAVLACVQRDCINPDTYQGTVLEQTVRSFQSNLERLQDLTTTPEWFVWFAVSYDRSLNALSRRFVIGGEEQPLRELEEERLSWIENNYGYLSGLALSSDDVACFASSMYPLNLPKIYSFCSSIIVSTWSLFETLAEDLWQSAADAKQELRPLKRDGTGLPWTPRFRRLESIAEAYERMFGRSDHPAVVIINSPKIRYLAAIRNVLIHKAGLVDDEFLRQTSGISEAALVAGGSRIRTNGVLTGSLVRGTIASCAELIGSGNSLPASCFRR